MYIGNEPIFQSFARDTFNGGGASHTLTYAPGTALAIVVFVDGVYQHPTTDYTVSGTTLTPVTAWPTGTNNVVVLYLGREASIGTPSDGTVTFAKLDAAVVATQAQLEAETASKLITASLAKYLPGMPKAFVQFDGRTGGVATIKRSYNVTSVTRTAQGKYTVVFTTAFSAADYVVVGWARDGTNASPYVHGNNATVPAVDQCAIATCNGANVIDDSQYISVAFFGDFA